MQNVNASWNETFKSDMINNNLKHIGDPAAQSSSSSNANACTCRNERQFAGGLVFGIFCCPLSGFDASETACCGVPGEQHCCRPAQSRSATNNGEAAFGDGDYEAHFLQHRPSAIASAATTATNGDHLQLYLIMSIVLVVVLVFLRGIVHMNNNRRRRRRTISERVLVWHESDNRELRLKVEQLDEHLLIDDELENVINMSF